MLSRLFTADEAFCQVMADSDSEEEHSPPDEDNQSFSEIKSVHNQHAGVFSMLFVRSETRMCGRGSRVVKTLLMVTETVIICEKFNENGSRRSKKQLEQLKAIIKTKVNNIKSLRPTNIIEQLLKITDHSKNIYFSLNST